MNQLQFETSPYLLQHKNNPVDWFPWGEEAFKRAKKFDKPILLSIGYSACHWCHVMAHESFENESIASLMNEYFINIKVDREERPDVDSVYMNYVQLTTGSGGWPLTVFLTPDLIPFYGGTYFPPTDKYNRPGFPRVLKSISQTYKSKKDEIRNQSEKIIKALESFSEIKSGPNQLAFQDYDRAFQNIIKNYDEKFGGFGKAPKFPGSMTLMFLLEYYSVTKNNKALEVVENSLRQMARGGMYDQLGGGFHRYSTDAEWLIPHFEKMLYDNALLSRLYLECYQLTKNKFYLQIADETLQYLIKKMPDNSGGFYSAQDADSEGEEGKYYVWDYDELKNTLSENELRIAKKVWEISPEGNFEGKNILTNKNNHGSANKELKMNAAAFEVELEALKNKLFNLREKRIKPGLDDKILVNWNSLAITSFALAYGITGNSEYLKTAIVAGEFIWAKCFPNEILFHAFKNEKAKIPGYIDDYSFLIEAYISLYQQTFDEIWLLRADRLNNLLLEKFYDPVKEEFYLTDEQSNELFIRVKDIYDNALPSGVSVAVSNLIRLSVYLNKPEYHEIAEKYISKMSPMFIEYPLSFSYLLSAGYRLLRKPKEIALIYDSAQSKQQFLREYFNQYHPNSSLAGKNEKEESSLEIFTDKVLLENSAITIYVCENYLCKQPVISIDEMLKLLEK